MALNIERSTIVAINAQRANQNQGKWTRASAVDQNFTVAAIKAKLTVQDPQYVHQWILNCTFELGRIWENMKKLDGDLSKKVLVSDCRLLNRVSGVLSDSLYLNTIQMMVDESLAGIACHQHTQAVAMLINGRAMVATCYDSFLDNVMSKLEKRQVIPRILKTVKGGNLKKSTDKYEKLEGLYAECVKAHQQAGSVRQRLVAEDLFLEITSSFGLPWPSVLSAEASSSSSVLPSSEEEEELDNATMIDSFMQKPQVERQALIDALSSQEKDELFEVVAERFDKWVSCSETEEELDYEWAEKYLRG